MDNNRQRQRGIADLWMLLIGVLVVLGLIAAIVYGVKSYVDGERQIAYQAGEKTERALWQKRESEELAAANTEILRLKSALDEQAQRHINELAAAGADYENKRRENEARSDRFIGDVMSGRIVLRDPGRTAGRQGAGPGAGNAAAGTVGAGDAAAGAALSLEATRFLWGEASLADAIVDQLTLAQREYRSLYEVCKKR